MTFATQIAGHGSEGDPLKAILKRPEDGIILKPVQPPPRGQREVNFYQQIFSPRGDSTDKKIRKHVPHFYRVESVLLNSSQTESADYLVLQDLTSGFQEPNILDLKIGAKTYGPDATESKRLSEDSKYIGTKQLFGFSVLGMIVHPLSNDPTLSPQKLDRSFGLNLQSCEVYLVPEIFFDLKNRFVPELISCVVKQLKSILKTFKKQKKFKIFASSVLIVYDAKSVKQFADKKISETKLKKSVVVKIIDFAHTFPSDGEKDDNFIFGLENIIELFQSCLRK